MSPWHRYKSMDASHRSHWQLNTTHRWFIKGGLGSLMLRTLTIFWLANTGWRMWPIFFFSGGRVVSSPHRPAFDLWMQDHSVTVISVGQSSWLAIFSPHARETGIRENFACAIRSPGFVIRNTLKKSGILLTIGIRNPSSTDKYWNPVPGIRNPRLSLIPLYGANL